MLWRYPTRTLAVAALVSAVLAPGHARARGRRGRCRAARRTDARPYEVRLHDAWLAAAAGNARVIEPRLTGGFAYGRTDAPPAPRHRHSSMPRAAAPAGARERAIRRPITCARSAWRYLLIGSRDEARDALERARAAAPDDPRVLSDLSAALLARSRAAEDTWDAVRALNHAERAWRLAPSMPEAAFNAALARERLHLRSEARKAWLAVQQLRARIALGRRSRFAHRGALGRSARPGLAARQSRFDRAHRRRRQRHRSMPTISRAASRRRSASICRRNCCPRGASRLLNGDARPPPPPRRRLRLLHGARRARRWLLPRVLIGSSRSDGVRAPTAPPRRGDLRSPCAGLSPRGT